MKKMPLPWLKLAHCGVGDERHAKVVPARDFPALDEQPSLRKLNLRPQRLLSTFGFSKMKPEQVPVVDEGNPFYCPGVPASAYLASRYWNRQHLPGDGSDHRMGSIDSEDSDEALKSGAILGKFLTSDSDWLYSADLEDPPPYSPMDLVRRSRAPQSNAEGNESTLGRHITQRHPKLKRKASEILSDLRGPPKYARSVQSYHDSSFYAELSRERLSFAEAKSSPPVNPKGSVLSESTLATDFTRLIEELDFAMPGIRLQERLRSLEPPTAQSIMTFLTENGTSADSISTRTYH